ncbi:MAG: hypothetical protein D6E12_11495 [Desulfovibrio sp.]|nr:MAG: hypothetical protein D6E12_11495 [Desulfovibrio sp.]
MNFRGGGRWSFTPFLLPCAFPALPSPNPGPPIACIIQAAKETAMYCTQCGQKLADSQQVCPRCGSDRKAETPRPQAPRPQTPQRPVPPRPRSESGEYAEFMQRFLAFGLDFVIVGLSTFIILTVVIGILVQMSLPEGASLRDATPQMVNPWTIAMLELGAFVAQWLYFAILESSRSQGTVGKIALRIKVTDMAGRRISFTKATERYFGKMFSGLLFFYGFVMILFTEKRQGLHDILVKTLVVKR